MSLIASVVMKRRRHGDDDCGDGGRVDCDPAATKRKPALFNVVGEHGVWAGRRRAFCYSTWFGRLREIGRIRYSGYANMICPTVDVNNLATSDQRNISKPVRRHPRTPLFNIVGRILENCFKPLPILKSGARGGHFRKILT